MTSPSLNAPSLIALIGTVFGTQPQEKACTILIDLPGGRRADSPVWKDRRRIALEWFVHLQLHLAELPYQAVQFCAYENVGSNNGDLPATMVLVERSSRLIPFIESAPIALGDVLAGTSVVIAMTELSATAPLKVLARTHMFRGATLPGFTRSMIPALGLDYEQVNRRVMVIQERMNRAESADVLLEGDSRTYSCRLDLRHRHAHASGGIIRTPGVVGNLPSGEAYIVPYEGERPGDGSRTEGELPVQFADEVVVFEIRNNRAVAVTSQGIESEKQRLLLAQEPAYGNIAELGIGVLGEWGVKAVGSTLLDEKLGLHIAFGRSEHFGGATGPDAFHSPERVIHIDWVYVPTVQPRVKPRSVVFHYSPAERETILKDGKLIF